MTSIPNVAVFVSTLPFGEQAPEAFKRLCALPSAEVIQLDALSPSSIAQVRASHLALVLANLWGL